MSETAVILERSAEEAGVRERLVVIGNGMAGTRLLEDLLARGGSERYEITVLGEEPHGGYNRVLLSGVLSGSYQTRDILTHPPTWYEENGITLHTGDPVVAIDRNRREVVSRNGLHLPYDRLVFATGSRAHVPEMEGLIREGGSRLPGIFVFRTLDDCRRMAAHATRCRRAVVLGGGLLGLEAASGLKELGLEVHVVHRAGHLMDRQLDAEGGAVLARQMRNRGIHLRLGTAIRRVWGEENLEGVMLTDGTNLPCEMLVLACGIRPNVELAQACGLPVERGIQVDDHLRTEDARVYAVGECAQHRGRMYGVVAPLWEQTAVLARELNGERPTGYPGSQVSTRLKVAGVELVSFGRVEARDEQDEVVQYAEPRRGIYQKLLIRDNRLVGAILLGDGSRAPYLTQLFERSGPLSEERASLLFNLGGGPASLSPAEMPDDATVCHCNGVRKCDILECLAGGARGLHDVTQATRASTGCGSCKPLVRALVDSSARLLSVGAAR